MNQIESFLLYLDELKTIENHSLIESVKSGFSNMYEYINETTENYDDSDDYAEDDNHIETPFDTDDIDEDDEDKLVETKTTNDMLVNSTNLLVDLLNVLEEDEELPENAKLILSQIETLTNALSETLTNEEVEEVDLPNEKDQLTKEPIMEM